MIVWRIRKSPFYDEKSAYQFSGSLPNVTHANGVPTRLLEKHGPQPD